MPAWSKQKYARLAKGYEGAYNHCLKRMINRVEKGMQKAYKDRKRKRRLIRREWILSINAAVREHRLQYSRFVYGLNRSNLKLDRKVLADLALHEPFSFKAVVEEVKLQAKLGQLDVSLQPMSFYEALATKNLIYGQVKPEQLLKSQLPYLRLRKDIDPKLRDQIVLDDADYAVDQADDWIFRVRQ